MTPEQALYYKTTVSKLIDLVGDRDEQGLIAFLNNTIEHPRDATSLATVGVLGGLIDADRAAFWWMGYVFAREGYEQLLIDYFIMAHQRERGDMGNIAIADFSSKSRRSRKGFGK